VCHPAKREIVIADPARGFRRAPTGLIPPPEVEQKKQVIVAFLTAITIDTMEH
jgi:hypothetical protein